MIGGRRASEVAVWLPLVLVASGCKDDPPRIEATAAKKVAAAKPAKASPPPSKPARGAGDPRDRDAPAPPQLVLFADSTDLMTKTYGEAKALRVERSDVALRGRRSLKLSYNEFVGRVRWAGLVFVVSGGWRKRAGDGADLSAYSRLSFFARAQRPGTRIELGIGADNEGKASKDSASIKQELTLTNRWREYTVDISQLSRGDINGLLQIGFLRRSVRPKERGWGSAVIWLDDIRFDKGQPAKTKK